MDSLPIDVIEVLCQYLSEQDIAACSSVCHSWRCVFNDDLIWKPLCSRRKQLQEHLRKTARRVKPSTALAEPPDSIAPLGRWRLAKMREDRLWNNIRAGEFYETGIVHDASQGFPWAQGFLTDDHVYLIFEEVFEVWDVREDPTVKVSQDPHGLTIDEIKSFKVVGVEKNRAVAVRGFNVRLFQIDCEAPKLGSFVEFRFDGKECEAAQESAAGGEPKWIISGSYLVGVNRGRSSVLHVWDLAKGRKIIEDDLRMPGLNIVNVFGSPSNPNIAVVLAPENQEFLRYNDSPMISFWASTCRYVHKVYCLKAAKLFQFTEESRATNGYCCAISTDFVAILDNSSLRVYNYKTAELIHDARGGFQHYVTRDLVFAVGDYFMYNTTSCHLEIYNPKTGAHYVVTDESGYKFFEAFMTPTYSDLEVLEDLKSFRKSCFHIFDKDAYQVTDGRVVKLGMINCKGMNFSGTRYLTISNYVSRLEAIFYALATAQFHPSCSSTLGNKEKRQLIVVRQFW